MYKISVADQFSETPGARYYSDGPKSGQEFYDKLLLVEFEKALKDNSKLTVDLDGTEGYATSFLDEAFRSLSDKFSPDITWNHLNIVSSEEPDWIEEIRTYIYKESE
ncbi:STAS-like domain-containing protein [Pedobacter sp. UYP1]|uniref:STAS-like domain-containing protein n=1 Tax=Pedobacter sp. UYP1 TaxID=1756396 RepID=UPI00339AEFEA